MFKSITTFLFVFFSFLSSAQPSCLTMLTNSTQLAEYNYREYYRDQSQIIFVSDSHLFPIQNKAYLLSQISFQGQDSNNVFSSGVFTQIQSSNEHLFASYQKRRGWSDEFISQLKNDVITDLKHSNYIVVEKLDEFMHPESVAASIKMIQAHSQHRQYKLPVERHLSLDLPYNNGLKVEPSNFIQISQDNESIQAISYQWLNYTQMLIQTYNLNLDENIYYTYGSELSYRLYKKYGFKKLASHYSEEIGETWYLLAASPQDVLQSKVATLAQSNIDLTEYSKKILTQQSSGNFKRTGYISHQIENFEARKQLTEASVLFVKDNDELVLQLYDHKGLSLFDIPITKKLLQTKSDTISRWTLKYDNNTLQLTTDTTGLQDELILEFEDGLQPKTLEYKHFRPGEQNMYHFKMRF